MATKIGRCLCVYSRLSSASFLRPVTQVSNSTHLPLKNNPHNYTTPVERARWYSDDTAEFDEPAEGYRYAKSHEWASLDGSTATIGISKYAQGKLGDVVYAELPEVGKEVAKQDIISVLESVKAAADVSSPVSGTVVEVNERLEENPELINSEPYKDGWIAKLKDVGSSEYDKLLSTKEYKEYLEEGAV